MPWWINSYRIYGLSRYLLDGLLISLTQCSFLPGTKWLQIEVSFVVPIFGWMSDGSIWLANVCQVPKSVYICWICCAVNIMVHVFSWACCFEPICFWVIVWEISTIVLECLGCVSGDFHVLPRHMNHHQIILKSPSDLGIFVQPPSANLSRSPVV